ncbi:MAG: DUF349 domain-containing protein, partial [Pseudonocardiaceae bacterium]
MTEDHQTEQHLETSAQSGPRPFVSRACRDPRRWGRIAADGTVYTHTADGERAVGSWQAGTTAEGLA